jgi:prepilin-type N-terminal cleavage/methylation domain-containing protein
LQIVHLLLKVCEFFDNCVEDSKGRQFRFRFSLQGGIMNFLANYRRVRRRRELDEINGFTLFEFLIVIVVLGILAAVVIAALGGITGKSATSACQADGSTVSTAIQAFTTQNPSVIPTESGLLKGTPADKNTAYIQSWPSNDPRYEFALTTDGQLAVQFPSKDIWANGETGGPSSDLVGGSPTSGELYQGAGTCASLT